MSQIFGMELHSLVKHTEQASKNQKKTKELGKEATAYLEQLKDKFSDVEIVVVEDNEINNTKKLMEDVKTDKELVVFVSKSELEAMATDEQVRSKNEQFIVDMKEQMPSTKEALKEAGVEVESFGMEFKDGKVTYFAIAGKYIEASSLEELLKKMQDIAYDKKADNILTEKEKLVGQHLDIKF